MTVENGCQCCFCKSLRTEEAFMHYRSALSSQAQAARISANARDRVAYRGDQVQWRSVLVREQHRAAAIYKMARRERDEYLKLKKLNGGGGW